MRARKGAQIALPHICAIVGASASGKSALSLQIAQIARERGQRVALFSLDSLAVYREVDIASAKPSKESLAQIPHFAIDMLAPDEPCSFGVFAGALQDALHYCARTESRLLLVGGSGFYLKAMIDGISPAPNALDDAQQARLERILAHPKRAHAMLARIDNMSAQKAHDSYRLRKAFEILLATKQPPSCYFAANPKRAMLPKIPIFELQIERDNLWRNITTRTESMLRQGLLDEVRTICDKYGRDIQPAKSIGFRECLAYFDDVITRDNLAEQIAIHTRQFAKRQRTFNRTQLAATPLPREEILQEILRLWGVA